MKKQQVDHVLRAAGGITGEKQFIIIGSQSLHGKYPDLADDIVRSAKVDLIAKRDASRTDWLNVIGQDSKFHEQFGYYADPVDETTAILPTGWKSRLVNLPAGDTGGVAGLCLDPHDLAIAKYVAGREKDVVFTRELASRGIVSNDRLLALLDHTPVSGEIRQRIRAHIARDFAAGSVMHGIRHGRENAEEPIPTTGALSLEEIRAQARKDWLKSRQQQSGESSLCEAEQAHGQERNDLPKDRGMGLDDDTTD